MLYDPEMVQPMREDLTRLGFKEALTSEDVDREIRTTRGTVLVMVNSVCGCAARKARPGVARALEAGIRPDNLITVFAGQDLEATARAREYFTGRPPSSPSVALLRDGRLVYMLERRDLEGEAAETIAGRLVTAFNEHCGAPA